MGHGLEVPLEEQLPLRTRLYLGIQSLFQSSNGTAAGQTERERETEGLGLGMI